MRRRVLVAHKTERSTMGIPSQRERVLTLLADIKDAARRPLFTEIGLFEALRTRRKLEDKTLTNRTPVVDVSGSLTRQADAGDLEASIVQKQTWEQVRTDYGAIFFPSLKYY